MRDQSETRVVKEREDSKGTKTKVRGWRVAGGKGRAQAIRGKEEGRSAETSQVRKVHTLYLHTTGRAGSTGQARQGFFPHNVDTNVGPSDTRMRASSFEGYSVGT